MKKITRILTLLLVFTLVAGLPTTDAQYYGKKKKKKKPKTEKVETKDKEEKKEKKERTDDYFDESGGFAHKLWYGGGFNINFSGTQNLSAFSLGLSPMAGYKVTDRFSIGPRVAFQYNYYKGFGSDGRTHKVEPFSYSFGAFSRFKLLDFLFAHAEYERESVEVIEVVDGFNTFNVVDGEVVTVREGRDNVYFGLGYSSGSILAYEIYLLYNFLEPEELQQLPFTLRIGFTYKF